MRGSTLHRLARASMTQHTSLCSRYLTSATAGGQSSGGGGCFSASRRGAQRFHTGPAAAADSVDQQVARPPALPPDRTETAAKRTNGNQVRQVLKVARSSLPSGEPGGAER